MKIIQLTVLQLTLVCLALFELPRIQAEEKTLWEYVPGWHECNFCNFSRSKDLCSEMNAYLPQVASEEDIIKIKAFYAPKEKYLMLGHYSVLNYTTDTYTWFDVYPDGSKPNTYLNNLDIDRGETRSKLCLFLNMNKSVPSKSFSLFANGCGWAYMNGIACVKVVNMDMVVPFTSI